MTWQAAGCQLAALRQGPTPSCTAAPWRHASCSVELARWSQFDKASQTAVGHAKSIFNSAFGGCLLAFGSCMEGERCNRWEGLRGPAALARGRSIPRAGTPHHAMPRHAAPCPTMPRHASPAPWLRPDPALTPAFLLTYPRAAPLVMSNGRNLIDMVCEAYESPDGGEPVAPKPQGPQKPAAQRGRGRRGRGAAAAEAEDGEEDEEEDEEEEPESFNFSESWAGSAGWRGQQLWGGQEAPLAVALRRPLHSHPPCAFAPDPPAGTFRVLLLRKRGSVVSAAAVRPFGSKFAGAAAGWLPAVHACAAQHAAAGVPALCLPSRLPCCKGAGA